MDKPGLIAYTSGAFLKSRLIPMLNHRYHGVLVALFAGLAAPALSCADELRVYVVDVQKVINESIEGRAARSNVEAEVKKSEAKLTKSRTDLDLLRADVQRQAALLSPEALEDKRRAVGRAEAALQDSLQNERDALAAKNNAEISRVVERIQAVVKELASSGTYPLIIEKDPRFLLYVDGRWDLSDEVVKRLDASKTKL